MTEEDPSADARGQLTRRTVTGLQWSYLQTFVSAPLQLVVAGILARLVDPAAFGLLALSNLTLRFVNYFARAGIGQAVVQKPEMRPQDIRAAFTISMGLAGVFAIVVVALAPVAADAFQTPELVSVLRWMSLQLPLFSFGTTADGLLRRELRFRAIALRSIGSYVIGYVGVGLPMALTGAGVWALVGAVLTQTALRSAFTFIARPHSLLPTFTLDAHRHLLTFGSRVSLISFLEFLGMELDTLAVGRYLGASEVGLYNRAYLLVKLPLQEATQSLSAVLFPAVSSIQDDVPRVRAALLTAIRLTSAFTLPVAAGMAVARREITLVVLGEDWLRATTVIPLIGLAAALNQLTHLTAIVAEARARLNPKLAITTLKVAVLVTALSFAADQGDLVWFAASLAAADLLSHVAYLRLTSSVADVDSITVVRHYAPSVAAAVVVAAAIWGVQVLGSRAGLHVAIHLVAEILTGAVVMLVLLRFGLLRSARDELLRRLRVAGMAEPGSGLGRMLTFVLGSPDAASVG